MTRGGGEHYRKPVVLQRRKYLGDALYLRLEIQHNLLLNATGGKHIHAPIDLGKIGAVLESGTGSGTFLLVAIFQLEGKNQTLIHDKHRYMDSGRRKSSAGHCRTRRS
jgi:hypothetical protein